MTFCMRKRPLQTFHLQQYTGFILYSFSFKSCPLSSSCLKQTCQEDVLLTFLVQNTLILTLTFLCIKMKNEKVRMMKWKPVKGKITLLHVSRIHNLLNVPFNTHIRYNLDINDTEQNSDVNNQVYWGIKCTRQFSLFESWKKSPN